MSNKKHKSNNKKYSKKYTSSDDDNSEEEFDILEYRKLLKTIFPSKYLDKKIAAGEKLKKCIEDSEDEDEDDDESDSDYETETSESEEEEEETEEEEEDDDEESEEEKEKTPKRNNKYNIIFTVEDTIAPKSKSKYYSSEELESCSEYSETETSETENEDDSVSSDDSSKKQVKDKGKHAKDKSKHIKEKPDLKEEQLTNNTSTTLDQLKQLKLSNTNDTLLDKCIQLYENKQNEIIKKKEKKTIKEQKRNSRIFKKIIRDKNTTNDIDFYENLDTIQQKKIIKELREINKLTRVEKPYRLTLLESNIPVIYKASAIKKINNLRQMGSGSSEYYKIKNWVDTFMKIPFGKYNTLPITIDDGVEKCHEFMSNAQKTLNDAVYGLNDAKMQIMQYLGQLITNPSAIGTAIAIQGPPGTGKTSLVKEGFSKILNRPFAFIALGGATDSSFLEGHGYTYEGSTWGKIVQILIDSKCMNPVIYFDELDKISDTPKGEEIAGILTHLTDTSQNSQFHDKYFVDIDFDLSKCLFIFSYNDESKINNILKDRMYRIQTKGYNYKQKTLISNNYLLPKIREQIKFNETDIIISEQNLRHIIETFCNKEDGVRNLKRCLEIIYTKLNLYRLMNKGSNLFEEDMPLDIQFPFILTNQIIDKLITKNENALNMAMSMLYS
jgi:ATP-dependent Lon protease